MDSLHREAWHGSHVPEGAPDRSYMYNVEEIYPVIFGSESSNMSSAHGTRNNGDIGHLSSTFNASRNSSSEYFNKR